MRKIYFILLLVRFVWLLFGVTGFNHGRALGALGFAVGITLVFIAKDAKVIRQKKGVSWRVALYRGVKYNIKQWFRK